MMTREMMLTAIEALGADASLWDEEDYCLDVTLEDFEGFDADWSEVDREYDDEEAVEAFLEMLEAECSSREGDFYVVYHFEGFDVQLGYASFDI
jgi:hypothetical protein